jgi:hypothetical protein
MLKHADFLHHSELKHHFAKIYRQCHVTSNKAKSNLGCAEEKFQTRGWVLGCET